MNNALAIFPGQGSQSVGMGAELYQEAPIAREIFDLADRILKFPLSKLCFSGPLEKLTETAIAQPAILTVSTICYQLALQSHSTTYSFVAGAGHSLGEYSALVAAEAISFEDAVLLVHKRGAYMQEAVPPGEGKMVAVLGQETSDVEEALTRVKGGVAQIANINAPGQIVVAGDATGIDEFMQTFSGAKMKPLQVSAPFHCNLMAPAADKLAKDLDALSIKPAKFPIYCNFTAAATSEPEKVRSALKQQVCGRVRWVECVTNALSETGASQAIEFGTGKVLTGLLKRISPDTARINVDSIAALSSV
ncbi:MAG: ACP S-malonyltransferase [Bdellovibrionales bacterium]|nr:ACP S-malonyltransferase [Bdellovibrionales bacterium]